MGAPELASLASPTKGVAKFGYNPSCDLNTEEDIWSYGGVYTFLTTPTTLYASSGNAGDTMDIKVIGLDEHWLQQEQTVTLTGQSQTPIPGTWMRVFRAFNDSGTDQAGDVYIAESDTLTDGAPNTASKVKAHITAESQQTEMAIYTIPADKTGYLLHFDWTIASNKAATFEIYVREFGKVWRNKGTYESVGTNVREDYNIWPKIPPKADIRMTATSTANGTGVSATFDILLVNTTPS